MKINRTDIAQLIVDEARAQGVPADVALAFAVAESNVANVQGDLELYKREGHMERVRQYHPDWRQYSEPSDWTSYGPFQLQALWYAPKGQPPTVLADVEYSVPRAVAVIKRLLARYDGDVELARIAYVCGKPELCSQPKREKIIRRFREAEIVARDYLEIADDDEPVPMRVLVAGALIAIAVWQIVGKR